jgi:cellulose biosynthesis protein BcsQ
MYIVTFYSFKGGTGRSMALVNTAVELVKNGRQVLIVDFDLEAPGLDTFNLPRPKAATRGVVDFVHEYLQTSRAPDVSSFVYKSPVLTTNGQLWVMPAGLADDNYDARFKSIDWQDLYENRDGYLLFEDLKLQWKKVLEPDYVLIDSRTGHTDVGGICTRQLPDAVAMFFFPNEQNRRGLEQVVSQIRTGAGSDNKKQVKLHFIMSNVPDLDDEQSYLAKNLAQFGESLGFDNLDAVIHNYPSLALLTQSIFTKDRPGTRLAKEYRQLTKVIRRENIEDPEAAIEFLEAIAPRNFARVVRADKLENRIQEIRKHHSGDLEVLVRLAVFLRRERRFDEALAALEEAGKLGAETSEFLLTRAELNSINGKKPAAVKDLNRFLEVRDAPYMEVRTATRLLRQLDPTLLSELPKSSAFRSLDAEGQYYVSQELLFSRSLLATAEVVLRGLLQRSDLAEHRRASVEGDLSLALIGQAHYAAAIAELTHNGALKFDDLGLQAAFNFAIAQWGLNHAPQPDLFRRVLELASTETIDSPNEHQCLAVAYWALDDTETALTEIGEALQQIEARHRATFSCWSYLHLVTKDFHRDLSEMERQLVNGEALVPRFLAEAGGYISREALQ